MIRRDLVLALRRAASQLSPGARRQCRLALSLRRTKGIRFGVAVSETRRMNNSSGGLLLERRTGLVSERRNHVCHTPRPDSVPLEFPDPPTLLLAVPLC